MLARLRRAVSWTTLALTCASPMSASEGDDSGAAGEPTRGDRPTLRALVIDPSTPGTVVVDGVLDEVVWQQAERGGGFRQRQPVELAPATEPTEVQVAFDTETLFVAVRAFDREPERIIAGEMGLDVGIFRDDGVVLLLDTFHDRRNAYFFETNANSSRTDGLVTDEGRDFNTDWDTIWTVRSRVGADGWTAEFAIPLSSLRFDPDRDVWGFQVRRSIKRKEELTFWAPLGLDADLFRMSQAGTLTGLSGLQRSRSLRVKPFLVGTTASSSGGDAFGDGDELDAGLDVKWGITNGLTLDATINTDFAETEVDEVQTNLTRFPLFFPEKREFFLENAGIFQFGPGLGPFLRPFFSRRIGIAEDGRMVDLEYGARLAGRQGPWNIGLLGARTGALAADADAGFGAVPSNDWGVARVKRNLGERSFAGVFASHRAGSDGSWQRVLGADVNWKPDDRWRFWLFGADSDDSEGTEDAHTFGATAGYQSDHFRSTLVLWEIGENWDPDAGFIVRNGTRNYFLESTWEPRPAWKGVRNTFHQFTVDYFEDLDGRKESVFVEFDIFGLTLLSGDFMTLFPHYRFERLDSPFEISDGVVIPAGEYSWNDIAFFITTPTSRPIDTDFSITYGDFFDGERLSTSLFLQWRPGKHFRTRTTWTHDEIDLPGGSFDTNVVRQRFEVSFTPDLVIHALIQASDASDDLGVNLRLNWHYRPGSDLFVVYNHAWDVPDLDALRSRGRQLIVKWTWAWQG